MKKMLFVILVNMFTPLLYAFTYHSNIETLTTKEGLANNTLHCIYQDKDNFVWFGTDMGISRYDGFNFRNFMPENKPHSISDIKEVPGGVFFMSEFTDNLYCFDRLKEIMIPVLTDNGISTKEFCSFQIIADSILYAATTRGLFKYTIDIQTKDQHKIVYLYGDKKPVLTEKISLLCKDENNCLYGIIENSSTVLGYNTTTGKSEYYDLTSLNESRSNKSYNKLFVYDNCLWICPKWSGVICYDLKKRTGQLLKQSAESTLLPIQYSDVYGVNLINKHTYYLNTRTGLYCLYFNGNPATSTFTVNNLPSLEKQHSPLLETRMLTGFYDSHLKQYWIGTFGGGAIKINMNDVFHNQIYLDKKIQVIHMAEDNNKYIWIATNRSGILKSEQDALSSHITFAPWRKAGDPTGKYTLHKDKNGNLWFGDGQGEFIHVNPLTDKATTYKLPAKLSCRINGIHVTSQDTVWIATTKGIVLFNPSQLSFKQFTPFITTSIGITGVIEDKQKNIWLGTERSLIKMNISGDSISFASGYEEQAGLNPSMVYSLQIYNENQLLVTYADKVILLDIRIPNKIINSTSLQKGLKNGHIYCSIGDHTGNIWLGSNSGIMTLSKDGNSFYDYLYSGNNNSVCQLHDGRLLWSNSWGLLFYNPHIIKEKRTKNTLFISSIAVNNKKVKTNEEINGQVILPFASNTLNEFTFNHHNKNFILYFTDLQYNSIQRKIAYRLLPKQKEWTEILLEQGISFGQLKNGKHTLQVYLISHDGSKGDVKEINIIILPHWSETAWAYALYLLIGLFTFLGIWYYFQKQNNKRRLLLEQQHQKEIAEERNELFILIAYELRTPLSLIIGPLTDLLHENSLPTEIYTRIELAYKNTSSIQDTCNKLLEISNKNTSVYPQISEEEETMSIKYIMNPTDSKIGKKKLLIVEDNESIRFYLQLLFTSHYIIYQATNGQEGIDLALKELPDAILCDVMMPIKDGLTCCREIKENLETCHIPLIMLTAKVQDKDIIEGLETGADDYITKPFNPDLLKSKVNNLINNRIKIKQGYMQEIMIPQEQKVTPTIQPSDENYFIKTVVEIIEKNISETDFNVKKLADILRMSQPTLYRKIKQNTDFTTVELIRGVRLKQAAILLKKQIYTVQEVAEKVGYNDVPTFRKHFTDFFGQLPSNYGKN